MYIDDGTGSGRKAAVTTDHFLQTLAQTFPYEHYINHVQRRAYSIVVDITPAGAGYCFFYLKNNDVDDVVLNTISLQSASQESIEITLNDSGTPVGGTSYTPVNCTSGSANIASVTAQYGTNLTGLVKSNVVDKIYCTSGFSQKYIWESDLILPKNTTVCMYAVSGSIRISFRLTSYFHSVYSHD